MSSLTAQQLETLRRCARDDAAFEELKTLFESQTTSLESLLLRTEKLAQVGGWGVDFSGEKPIPTWTPEMYTIHGLESGSPLEIDEAISYYREDVQAQINDAFISLKETGKPYNLELPFVSNQGEKRWVALKGRAERQEGDSPYLYGIMQDITEQKQAEIALRESEARYHLLFDHAPVMLHTVDINYRLIDVNDYWLKATGYSRDEVIGQYLVDFIHPDRFPANLLNVAQHFREQGIAPLHEYELTRKDGSYLPVLATARGQFDDAGNLFQSISFMVDLSERKRIEAQVDYQTSLLNKVHDAIVVTDANATITYWNKGAERLYGWTADEVMGENFEAVLKVEYLQTPLEDIRKQLETAGQWHGELLHHSKDGRSLPMWVSLSALHGPDGKFNEIVGVNHDISDLKNTEQALSLMLKKEKELREVRSRFLSIVSHEFRNPLANIQMAASFLENYLDRMKPEDRDNRFKRIYSEIDHLTGLLEELIVIGQGDSGDLELHISDVEIDAFCAGVIDGFRRISDSQIQLDYICEVDRVLQTDANLLRQILGNLLSNAIKYSPEGGTVTLHVTEDEQQICFTVSDDGIGIPPEDLEQLFEAFYRADNAKPYDGTGLGLFIVKRAVDLLGGTVNIEGKETGGTVCVVTLPPE